MTEIVYIVTMISWAFYRLWEFPSRVIWAASNALSRCPDEALEISRRSDWMDWAVGQYQQTCVPGFHTNLTLLWVLFVLHCWWFFLLARIGLMLSTDDASTASKKEYEGDMDAESDDEDEAKKIK